MADIFADELTPEERVLLSRFRAIPAGNHDMVQRFLAQVQASAAPATPENEPSALASKPEPAK